MSKYNFYAKKLDTAFHEAAKLYREEAAKLNAAQEARDKAFAWSPSTPAGIAATLKEAKQQTATVALQAAQAAFSEASRRIVEDYQRNVAKMKLEFSQAISTANLVNPAAVDNNALALLNSGIMTAADFQHMLDQFSDNPTMRRLIGKFAGDAVKTAPNQQDSATLRAIHSEAGRDSYTVVEAFNALADISVRYLGASAPERHTYALQMQTCWDKGDIQEAIENF